MYGQKFGRKLVKPLRLERNRKGQKKNQSSTMLGKLRGIYLNDPDGEENKDILRNARSKLERPVAPAMSCKRMDKQHPGATKVVQNNGKEKGFKTMYGCMVESHESTRQRPESSQSKKHEDHTAGIGFTYMTHYNLVHKFIPDATRDENFGCKGRSGQGMERARENPNMGLGKSQKQKGGYSGSTKRQKRKSTLLHWWTYGTSKNAELEPQLQKGKKGRVVVLRVRDIVKDDSGAYAVFTRQGLSASQMTARLWRTTSRCSICWYSGKIGGCSEIAQNS